MVSQDNESSKDFTAIECKVRILHMFQLQREIECNRGFESEDDDDDYESEDDDDYDTQDDDDYDTEEDTGTKDDSKDDAEPLVEKDTSPRRYRTSEFPLFSPTFWGNSTNGYETTELGPMLKDTSSRRYRTSEFPLFSTSFWGGSTKVKDSTETSVSITTNLGIDDADPVPRANEGPKLLPAHQSIKLGMTLTSDDIGDEDRSLTKSKKMDKAIADIGRINNSANKYKYTGIPALGKVRQKSLPPISKRQECHMITRQKSLPPIEKRIKPQTAEAFISNKKDNTGRSLTADSKKVENHARNLNRPPSKPRFQGGPYEAKPFKLLPPIATKSGRKQNAKDTNTGDGHQKKENPKPIKVRHTKKSAQIELKAKAKRDAENDGKRKASAIVKPPLVGVPVSSAPKSKSTASCITAPDWSTRKHKKLPPIRKLKDASNGSPAKAINANTEFNLSKASGYVDVTSVVAAMSEKMDTTKADRNYEQIPSSKSCRSSDIKRSRRDHRSRSLSSRSSSSTRSKKSTRVFTPCRSSRFNCASRSDSPREEKKSARVSTTGSHTSTNRGDTSERSGEKASCTPAESRCVSRRSRRDKTQRSSSPRLSDRSSHPGSPHMKDKSDGNAPHNGYDYSPKSTARSSVHTNRSQPVLSDTARTYSSASNASRNMPRVKSTATSTRGSSNMSIVHVPKQSPTSQGVITKHGSTGHSVPSRPNTAPGRQKAAMPHPNTASSYPSSARHSTISVRPNTASLLRQKSVSSRQSIVQKCQSTDSVHRDSVFSRQSTGMTSVLPNTTLAHHVTEQNHHTTAPPHPATTAARPTTALARATTAPSRQSTTPTPKSKIPLRIATSQGKASARSSTSSVRSSISSPRSTVSTATSASSSTVSHRSTCSSRNNTAVLKMSLTVPY